MKDVDTDQLDDVAAAAVQRALATEGNGADAFTAVLEAMLVTGRSDAHQNIIAPHVWRLWFTPWRIDPGEKASAREARWLAHTTPATLQSGARELSGFTCGDGPAVLLVHGWGDCASRMGAFIEPLRRLGLQVVAYDLPAHGNSGDGETNFYEFAAAISTAIAAHDVRAVIAHSAGAQAAVRALRDAAGVEAAALLAPAVRLESTFATFVRVFDVPPPAATVLHQRITESFGPHVWTDVSADFHASSLRLPGLIVHSRDDDQVSFTDSQLLIDAWTGSRLEAVDGLGHARILRDAGVLDLVTTFVAERVQRVRTP